MPQADFTSPKLYGPHAKLLMKSVLQIVSIEEATEVLQEAVEKDAKRRATSSHARHETKAAANAGAFIKAYEPMETIMATGVSCPVEKLIVELAVTPRNLRSREKMAGVRFPWFAPA